MAKNNPPGDGHRIGAVKGRSQNQDARRQLGQARRIHWPVHGREDVRPGPFQGCPPREERRLTC